MFSKHHLRQYVATYLILATLFSVGCNGMKRSDDVVTTRGPHKIENPDRLQDQLREKTAEYERRFTAQVDLAYKLYRGETSVPISEIVESDEIHIELALSGKDFWQKLRVGFTEIGRDTRSDFTDQFITLPHQSGVRVGFVDLVRAKAIWNAIRGDTNTDLVLILDIPLVPDLVMHENPQQYPSKKVLHTDENTSVAHAPSFTVLPKGNIVDVQGAKFADGSLRFAKFDLHFPELKQEGRRNVKTRRSGSLKQIKTTTWRESPKVRREHLSLSQLVLPKGVAMVALVPADCTEVSESSDWTAKTYIPSRNKVSTSLILLILPKRVAEAFESPP